MAAREVLLATQEGQTQSKGKPVWEVIFDDGLVRQYAASNESELQALIWYNQSTPRRRTGLDSLDQILLWDKVTAVIPSYGMVYLARRRERIEYQVCVELPGYPSFLVRVEAFNARQAAMHLYQSQRDEYNLPLCPERYFPRLVEFESKHLRFLGATRISINPT